MQVLGILVMSLLSSRPFLSKVRLFATRALDPIEKRVHKTLQQCQVKPNDKLLLAISGGVDSMAMLHILSAIKNTTLKDIELRVIHFNHRKRVESEEEAVFVQSIAASYGISSEIRFFDPSSITSSFQAKAREWRRAEYESLLDDWKQTGGGNASGYYVLAAHHLDDQIETVVMRLLRGAHISRLDGVSILSLCILHDPSHALGRCARGPA